MVELNQAHIEAYLGKEMWETYILLKGIQFSVLKLMCQAITSLHNERNISA